MLTTLFFVSFCIITVFSYPGEIIYGCTPAVKEWTGKYAPWSGTNTKNAYAHLTFDDGPELVHTPIILDVLKEFNISATFFVIANKINDDTKPIMQRMIDEGHTIGSHSYSHKNLQYANMSLVEEEVDLATDILSEIMGGTKPKLFRPPFGSIDVRGQEYLKEEGYTIVLWSAGCVDWWFTDNNIPLNASIAAMRFGLAEEGGIVCMHDRSEAPNDAVRLKKFINDIWNFWDFVDFNTCIGRDDVDNVPWSTQGNDGTDGCYKHCISYWSLFILSSVFLILIVV